ncbi:MAG: FG-GAP repeat protein [Deltaproteobacteria bacterium]|nr:FG-GAP repeat protein [Deltaproteobacteria bacterium]
MLLLLLACDGGDTGKDRDYLDTADTGDNADTGDTGTHSGGPLSGADLVIDGEASSATGFGLAFAPGASGTGEAWVTAYFTSRACRFSGQVGTMSILDAPLCVTNTGSGEYMGASIAVSGQQVALGAVGGREAGAYAGKAYVFDVTGKSGEMTAQDAIAVIYAEVAGDYLGNAAAYVGDPGGDGHDDLLLGAPANDDYGPGAGRAYLFASGFSAAELWANEADTRFYGQSNESAVRHGAPEAGDGVGSVLNGAGDLNGDGLGDLVLGVNGADEGGADAGLAAVFFGPAPAGDVSIRDADVIYVGEADGEYVGDFADGVGDLDGDGHDEILVSGDIALAGKAWLFHGPGTSGAVSTASTILAGESNDDQFGASLAGAGDVDGDGTPDIVVGAYGSDRSGLDAGVAYVFHAPLATGTVSSSAATAVWTGLVEGDGAGRAVEGGGDYDGDGKADLLVGAPYADVDDLAFSGQAFLVLGQ